jgi:hypothetical protein
MRSTILRHAALALLAVLTSATHSQAACNLIPGTEKSFSATLGATNRPYAAPGERLELRLRACDASPGFLPAGTDHVVTLVFEPLSGTNRRIVVLAAIVPAWTFLRAAPQASSRPRACRYRRPPS